MVRRAARSVVRAPGGQQKVAGAKPTSAAAVGVGGVEAEPRGKRAFCSRDKREWARTGWGLVRTRGRSSCPSGAEPNEGSELAVDQRGGGASSKREGADGGTLPEARRVRAGYTKGTGGGGERRRSGARADLPTVPDFPEIQAVSRCAEYLFENPGIDGRVTV